MATGSFGSVARGVDRLFGEGTVAGLSEGQLLDRFLARGDALAFEALVACHGPMVLATCRRVLGDAHAAEDAFQATFLLLVRKADSIRRIELLGPWLHRVAYRVAVRASRAESRRKGREIPSEDALAMAVSPAKGDRDLALAIHEALDALPEKYRAPVVLCDLEGRTYDEAAHRLKWPIGSVKGRLSRAREMLRSRLARRGVVASSGAIAAALAGEIQAAVPVPLLESTTEAASALAAGTLGTAAASGTLPAAAAALAEEAARAMMFKKLGAMVATLAAVGVIAGGAAVLARQEGVKPNAATKSVESAKPDEAKVAPTAPEESDLARLQGRWTRIRIEVGGRLQTEPHAPTTLQEFVIRKDVLYPTLDDGNLGAGRTLKLDPSASPRTFEWRRAGAGGEEITRGIYHIQSDKRMVLCYDPKDPLRAPEGFRTDGERTASRVTMIYTRSADPTEASPRLKEVYEKLQGEWRPVAREAEGEWTEVRENAGGGAVHRWMFEGTKLRLSTLGRVKVDGSSDVVIDLDRKPPVMEIRPSRETLRSYPNAAPRQYAFRLDGDTLLLCQNAPEILGVPDELVTRPGDGRTLMEYRRVKAGDLERLQGTWTSRKPSEGDPSSGPGDTTYRFEGDRVDVRANRIAATLRVELAEDRLPKAMRLTPNGGAAPLVQIYQLSEDGNELTIAAYTDARRHTTAPLMFRPSGPDDQRLTVLYRSTETTTTLSASALEFKPQGARSAETKSAPGPSASQPEPPISGDLQRLQGRWKVTGRQVKVGGDSGMSGDIVRVEGRSWIAEDDFEFRRGITLEEGRDPRVLRLQQAGPDGTARGVALFYRLKDRTLTVWKSDEAEAKKAPAGPLANPPIEFLISFERIDEKAETPAGAADSSGAARKAAPASKPADLRARKAPAPSGEGKADAALKSIPAPGRATDGPTGVEMAADLRGQAAVLADQRDDLLDQAIAAEDDVEFLRQQVRDLRKKLDDQQFDLGAIPTDEDDFRREEKRKLAARRTDELTAALERRQKAYAQALKDARRKRRDADEADRKAEELRAKADEAARRPGKPNTTQVGDVLLVEVLEALPGRPIAGERLVRPDGTITLGFYGDLFVAGLTRKEIKEKVIIHLRKFLNDESLGLIAEPVDAEGNLGKPVAVPPAESDRVFVDDSRNYESMSATRAAEARAFERKIEELRRELRNLQNSDAGARGRRPTDHPRMARPE